jgi:hypothetical protein
LPAGGLELAFRHVAANRASTGDLYGEVELDEPFSAMLTFGEHTVTLANISGAEPLTNVVSTVQGDNSAPDALDVTWDGPDDGFVFTHIPINHHAAAPTFTECWTPASEHMLHIDDAMLDPLAVETGLEFQGVDHVQVAAAQTPAGCVELRATYEHNPF